MRGTRSPLAVTALACALITPTGWSTMTAAAEEPVEATVVTLVTEGLASELRRTAATELSAREILYSRLRTHGQADPTTVFAGSGVGQSFTQQAVDGSLQVKEYLELPGLQQSGLLIVLADPNRLLDRGVSPLFAATPADEEASTLHAEELDGTPVELNLAVDPDRPVILVDLDEAAVTEAIIQEMSAGLREEGVQSDVLPADYTPPPPPQPLPGPMTTRLDSIRLDDNHEGCAPLFGCDDAEVVTFAMGGGDGTARANLIGLHTVNQADTTYTPLRTIINWSQYTWSQVDFLIVEIDPRKGKCGAGDSRRYGKVVAEAIKGPGSNASYVPLNALALDAVQDRKKVCGNFGYQFAPDHVDSFDALSTSSTGTLWGSKHDARVGLSAH